MGELVALKWEDWCDEKHLHIVREEVRDQTDNSYCEYIFMRDGERITSIRIATILRKFARSQNVPLKSSHKLRKTYASNLNKSGVPLDCIREQLGHASLATTLEYIYNPLTENQTYDLISKAL